MRFTSEQRQNLAATRYKALVYEFGSALTHANMSQDDFLLMVNAGYILGLPIIIITRDTDVFTRPGTLLWDMQSWNDPGPYLCDITRIVFSMLRGTQAIAWREINNETQKNEEFMSPIITTLANTKSAIDAIRQNLIRCGFELEFQALNGSGSAEVDLEALRDNSQEAWDALSFEATFNRIEYEDEEVAVLLRTVRKIYSMCSMDELLNLFDGLLYEKVCAVTEDAEVTFREVWESDHEHEYRTEPADVYESLDVSAATAKLIDCGADQSVRGGEIRTEGPLTPMQFLAASENILDDNEFDVDTGCSFHIHLSVPGITHTYGSKIQAEMIAYLLDNKARLPAPVRDRLVSQKLDQYAQLRISEDKFTAVHFHQHYKTWEFRLFGNISTSSDARRCLILAIEAMRWAYRVKLGLDKSLVTAEVLSNFEQVAKRARTTISSFKKERRLTSIANYRAA